MGNSMVAPIFTEDEEDEAEVYPSTIQETQLVVGPVLGEDDGGVEGTAEAEEEDGELDVTLRVS